MQSSRRSLFIDMVVDSLIFKNNQITPYFTLIPKQVWDYLKQGLVFAYCRTRLDEGATRGKFLDLHCEFQRLHQFPRFFAERSDCGARNKTRNYVYLDVKNYVRLS